MSSKLGPRMKGKQKTNSFDDTQNRVTYTLPSYKNIANGAQNVKQQCQRRPSGFTETSGQGFFDGNWNVIVRGDSC